VTPTEVMDRIHSTRSHLMPEIKIAKRSQSDILPSRKAQALHGIEQMASELGRMQKLLDELRADVLHLTVE